MRLYLMQHGEAMLEEQDPKRRLTATGRETTERMAGWLAKTVVRPDEIWHSGKTRAEQTAGILVAAFGADVQVSSKTGLSPGDDPHLLRKDLPKGGSVILVGHLPHLERLAGLLLAGSAEASPVGFRNSGIVCLEKTESGWQLLWAVVPELVP
jgi:phosphohistidine phosphatase